MGQLHCRVAVARHGTVGVPEGGALLREACTCGGMLWEDLGEAGEGGHVQGITCLELRGRAEDDTIFNYGSTACCQNRLAEGGGRGGGGKQLGGGMRVTLLRVP
jgi:hypothetical protein